MTDKKDGGPAFPTNELYEGSYAHGGIPPQPGMALRDWFAGGCPLTVREAWEVWNSSDFELMRQGQERLNFWSWYALMRWEYADAMLAAREGRSDD